jgi:pimeloyl-ACP methyl ester carboxylesterase
MNSEKSRKSISPRIFRKSRFGQDKFILVRKFKIHYVEAGQGEPVILIPGSYNTRRTWNRLIPLLSKEFRLLALDYIGRVDSDEQKEPAELTLQEQTDIIAEMVRQIGLEKVNLIGGYSGGSTVYDFAARYPDLVNKIISIEGSLVQSSSEQNSAAESLKAKNAARLPWYKINLIRKSAQSLEEEAKSIRAPLMYLFGTNSDIKRIQLEKNLAYFKTNLPHAWVVALEGSVHDLNSQHPLDMANVILEFLRKKLASRSS